MTLNMTENEWESQLLLHSPECDEVLLVCVSDDNVHTTTTAPTKYEMGFVSVAQVTCRKQKTKIDPKTRTTTTTHRQVDEMENC